MTLDPTVCARARLARDPRFDGQFFVGVLTTKIYCRPICPARPPKEENIRYFTSAAAAAEAGLRPCLRCRPESAPGTPAWMGTSTTVSRALRLIDESELQDGGVDELAGHLGIGSRHLRRLFLQHLGASPIAVIQTRRLHFAKKLIDETRLPLREIAMVAGYGSIRRFNDTFQKTYHRSPTHIRNLRRAAPALPENEYQFTLRYRPPFHWDALLNFLAPRAIPGVEEIDGDIYRRIFSLHGHVGWLEASHNQTLEAISLRIRFPEPRWLFQIVERVRKMFDLTADPNGIAAHLRQDSLLAEKLATKPGLRVPGGWDGFELAVRAILGQQVTVAGATTLTGRLVKMFGTPVVVSHKLTHLFPPAEKLAKSNIAKIGLPKARAQSICSMAKAVAEGRIKFSSATDLNEFVREFCELPGIGSWTAHYVAMRVLGEPDAFPASDLGLLRAAGLRNSKQLEARAEAWRPWRAYAAMYLWQGGSKHERNLLHANRKPGRAIAAGGRRRRTA